jgi:hypothetical protein
MSVFFELNDAIEMNEIFVKNIKDRIKIGYVPLGGISTAINSIRQASFSQAMVKYEEEN